MIKCEACYAYHGFIYEHTVGDQSKVSACTANAHLSDHYTILQILPTNKHVYSLYRKKVNWRKYKMVEASLLKAAILISLLLSQGAIHRMKG